MIPTLIAFCRRCRQKRRVPAIAVRELRNGRLGAHGICQCGAAVWGWARLEDGRE